MPGRFPHRPIAAATNLQLSERDREAIHGVIEWRDEPHFPFVGRSAWHRLQQPFPASLGGQEVMIRAIEFKGVGLGDHGGQCHPPSPEPYVRHILTQADFVPGAIQATWELHTASRLSERVPHLLSAESFGADARDFERAMLLEHRTA